MSALDPLPEPEPRDWSPSVADRAISPIGGGLGSRRSRLVTLAALVLGCGIFLAATWERGDRGEPAQAAPDAPPRAAAPFEPAPRPDAPQLAEAALDPYAPSLYQEAAQTGQAQAAPPEPDRGPSRAETAQALAESARRAPVLAYSRPAAEPQGLAPALPAGGASGKAGVAPTAPTALDALRVASAVDRAAAARLPDRNLLIAAGASLPCVLQTALDSTTPGYVACVLPRDVYSDDGAVVLMERGTRILGEARGGLEQGRARLFVLWTRAVTPGGVTIALASPAADGLGRAGLDGEVDTRFWDRFGGALLLSIVDEAAALAPARDDRLARLPSDAASTALSGSIDIPPTLRKPQGSEVTVFVARDLDFRAVYRLAARP